jgi:hypothetical protein
MQPLAGTTRQRPIFDSYATLPRGAGSLRRSTVEGYILISNRKRKLAPCNAAELIARNDQHGSGSDSVNLQFA